jgi:hypothetical protein
MEQIPHGPFRSWTEAGYFKNDIYLLGWYISPRKSWSGTVSTAYTANADTNTAGSSSTIILIPFSAGRATLDCKCGEDW